MSGSMEKRQRTKHCILNPQICPYWSSRTYSRFVAYCGVDEEAAGARFTLSLDILKSGSSTPSISRCVEIIEQLLRKDEEEKEESCRS